LKPPTKRASATTARPRLLDDLPFTLTRSYYGYLLVLKAELARAGLAPHVRPGMGPLLFALADGDDCVIRTLCARTRLQPSTLSRTLVEMEKSGLITRHRDAEDARATRIRLTPLGRSILPPLRRFHRQLMQLLHGPFDAQEATTLGDLLLRFVAGLERKIGIRNS
jgi:DNA-binding MarR family transcriptional regulator